MYITIYTAAVIVAYTHYNMYIRSYSHCSEISVVLGLLPIPFSKVYT